jgi:ATP-binding cassette subfamily B protein
MVSYTRIKEILSENQEVLDEAYSNTGNNNLHSKVTGKIEFKNVTFEYNKGIPVLDNVSFTCEPGQVISLLGETGSGKTSLINLIPRFYDYTSGDILLDGKPIMEYSKHFLRNNIGIVEQEPFLFSMTLKENIAYGVKRNVTQKEIENAAKAAAIHDSIIDFPDGYKTMVGEKGVTLSGGQKQRIAIARVILKNPRILILDDSTSAIDAETEEQINMALLSLMQNRTTFIIAHRVSSLMKADLILVFKNGSIIQRGTHKELIGKSGFYNHIFELQTQIEQELEEEIHYA